MSPEAGPGDEPVRPVYDRIGTTYARYRQPDPRIAARIQRALGAATTVLDVGAGTGSYETGDHTYIAVEPSSVMIGQRRQGAGPSVRAAAEQLPFSDRAFGAAMAILTTHHWSDPGLGLSEVARVTDGPVVVLTWDAEVASRFWLVEDYLPEIAAHDAGIVTLPEVTRLLGRCRVEPVPVPHDCVDGFLAAYWRRPERYLDPGARAAISGLALLEQRAVARMVDALAADLASGAWQRRHGHLLTEVERDYGYRLVVGPA